MAQAAQRYFMSGAFDSTFRALRSILQKHAGKFSVKDSARCYSLEGTVGPATLQAWGGKLKRRTIPVGWVQIGKGYVSYHLMGLAGNAKILEGMSKELKARMQGKTCFNFKSADEGLLRELDSLTAQALAAFERAGHVSQEKKDVVTPSTPK
jgi:hypothetical protein